MRNIKIPHLTEGEESIMQVVWKAGIPITIGQVMELTADSHIKYTTVATFVKLLESKGYLKREPLKNSFTYYPLIGKDEYAQKVMDGVMNKYFGGSLPNMVSFFSQKEQISDKEREEILCIINKAKVSKKE